MNTDETDLCSSVLLTCESLSGGQGYFHREDAKSAKKNDFKNFAFFASSRWIFWVAAGPGCTVFIGGFNFVQFLLSGLRGLRFEFFDGLREPCADLLEAPLPCHLLARQIGDVKYVQHLVETGCDLGQRNR